MRGAGRLPFLAFRVEERDAEDEHDEAQWVAAERPLAALFSEPQSRLPLTGGGQVDTPQRSPTESPPEARLPELPVHRDALPIVQIGRAHV